ncbi:uncharacterized protein LACBIDRAFT_310350 [Laccaria bicolor S238N-H82]|uniref:Predicted protein n=1 Tax=Laccaria bicolor (strain S238N-H82 / ATCC MYA-4686) TaxID=486041 RepID=B0DU56_LACBS|nr:uncharacterized protein LACBIDRAFT_310350 [Laccaria bicolor S238N-H82]EDR01888.1 predicted protein [Laccaria bicolor S238N-H82]|eukprot:XP_001887498.1 predicted protein [Laccaria bicolor S238N-H82]
MHKLIIKAWEAYFKDLKQELADAPGQISYMGDIWPTKAQYPYLAITTHWIHRDKSTKGLQLCSALIAFHCL